MAHTAHDKLANLGPDDDAAFYESKLATADFYFERLLPRTKAHKDAMLASTKSVMGMPADNF